MAEKPETGESKDQRGWRGLLAGLKRRITGDVIAAEVGDDARGVAVGKNIIQIGSLIIPTLPLLALVLLTASAFAYLVFQPRGPKEMSGEFNIAIAQFGQLDTAGNVSATNDAKNLSRWFFERLQTEYAALTPKVNAEIWHDSLDLGVKIGNIPGSTPEERSEAAADLAERIRADVIVYGNLDLEEDGTRFIPEFFVAELPDAAEIVGYHQLGTPIQLQLPVDRLGTRLQFNQKLSSRAKALTFFTIGLAWEFSGRPDTALDFFWQAAEIEDWADNEGKEIVYLFIGREAFFLWWNGQDLEAEVQDAFQRALDLNPDYGRANIGLGNFYFQRAKLDLSELEDNQDQILGDVERAITEYQQALDSEPEIPGGTMELPAHLALSGAYRLKGDIYLRLAQPEQADKNFDLAITEAKNVLEMSADGGARDWAHAYLFLGSAYHLKAHNLLAQGDRDQGARFFRMAFEAYTSCSQYIAAQPPDWYLEDIDTNSCTPFRQVVEEVLADL